MNRMYLETGTMLTERAQDEPIDFRVCVVLPAGGTGDRFGCDVPKQYSQLLGHPLILHTIFAFHRISWIQEIVVPVSQSYLEYMRELCHKHKFHKVVIVEGFKTRHRSIHAGVKALSAGCATIVIVHDAVRLFVDEEIIRKVAVCAQQYGASGVTRPLISTVISEDADSMLVESLDRSRYRASEMPQGFTYSVIKTAYDKANNDDLEFGTECLLLALKYSNTRAKLIHGPEMLWKVTFKKDLYAAEGILKEQYLCVHISMDFEEKTKDLMDAIVDRCLLRNINVLCNPEAKCNSHVFIYTNLDLDTIQQRTSQICSPQVSCFTTTGLYITKCAIHIYHGEPLTAENQMQFMEFCEALAKTYSPICLYGILNFKTSDLDQLSEMVCNLINHRDPSLSGQTFFIRK